jgi:hypothetical protein
MTDTQRNALKIVIDAVISAASNGYTVKVDDIITVIEGIIEKEKETQFIPGLYPNDTKTLKPYTPGTGNIPPPYPSITGNNPKLWDQVVYTYNSTSTTDVNSNTNDDIQKICEKNPIRPIEPNEWDDNEF